MTRTQSCEVPVSTSQHNRLRSNSVVRIATVKDIDALIDIGGSFLNYSAYGSMINVSKDDVARGLCSILDTGVIFVSEKNGEITGGIAGVMGSIWFASQIKVATELGWWVNEKNRGEIASIKLLRAFENWAKENGASHIVMSDLVIRDDTPAGHLFEKLGYVLTERAHIKGV